MHAPPDADLRNEPDNQRSDHRGREVVDGSYALFDGNVTCFDVEALVLNKVVFS